MFHICKATQTNENKAKKRKKERVYNLAYSLVFTISTNSPRVSVAFSNRFISHLCTTGCRLAIALLGCPGLHTAVLSSAQHCFLIPALKEHPHPSPSTSSDMLFSWQKAEAHGKPIHDSTLKASTWTWAYILSRHSLLA